MSDIEGARHPAAPFVQEWVIDRAKEKAERYDTDKWAAFLEATIAELEWYYGWPLPERDPRREQNRRQAVENQRVLNPERFVNE